MADRSSLMGNPLDKNIDKSMENLDELNEELAIDKKNKLKF